MRDLFKERGINPNEQRDLFAERGIMPPSKSPPSKGFGDYASEFGKGAAEFGKGAAQGFANSEIGTADLIPGVNIPTVNYAPDTFASKVGQFGGELGSFFMPGFGQLALLHKSLGAIKSIPHIANAINSVAKSIKGSKSLNVLSKLGKGAGEGALFGAIQNPEEQVKGAEMGAAFGATGTGAAQLLRARNPIINALARIGAGGAGGALGYGIGGPTGAALGSAAGFGAPELLKFGQKPGRETLEHLKPEDVQEAVAAGNRLDTPLSPAEASGNPFVGRLEGGNGRTGEAAAEKTRIKLKRKEAEKGAINSLLTKIYDKSVASDNAINNLYKKAYESDIDKNLLAKFKEDPVIANAFEEVRSSPELRKDLKDIPENNLAYLDQVKVALNDKSSALRRQGYNNKARIIDNTEKGFVQELDKASPSYAPARQEAQRRIVRRQIEEAMQTKEIKGTDFYKTILKNDHKFDELLDDLKNVPEAQAMLKDMKLAWKNLINIDTARGAAGKAETSMSSAREAVTKIMDMWHELTGAKANVKAIKYINSPTWVEDFSKISKIKDKRLRNDKIAEFLGKALGAGLTPKKMNKE